MNFSNYWKNGGTQWGCWRSIPVIKHCLSLYFSYDKKQPKEIFLGTNFTTEDKFQILLDNIKKVMDIKREETRHLKSGVKIYHFYF